MCVSQPGSQSDAHFGQHFRQSAATKGQSRAGRHLAAVRKHRLTDTCGAHAAQAMRRDALQCTWPPHLPNNTPIPSPHRSHPGPHKYASKGRSPHQDQPRPHRAAPAGIVLRPQRLSPQRPTLPSQRGVFEAADGEESCGEARTGEHIKATAAVAAWVAGDVRRLGDLAWLPACLGRPTTWTQ